MFAPTATSFEVYMVIGGGACPTNHESVSAVNRDLSPKMTERKSFNMYWRFMLAHVPSTDIEEAGFSTWTEASHQGAIKMIRLHLCEAVMSSIFIYSLKLNVQIFQLPGLSSLVNISISGLLSSLSKHQLLTPVEITVLAC